MFPILTNEISNRFNEKYFQKLYDRKLQLSKIKQDSCRKNCTSYMMNDVGKQRNGMDDQRLNTLLCFIQTYNRWTENYNYQKNKTKEFQGYQ